jgi:hypothetical protein
VSKPEGYYKEKLMLSLGEVLNILTAAGLGRASMQPTDATYAVPNKEFLLGKFAEWFADDLKSKGIAQWKKKNDCDNFAIRFYDRAQWSHKESQKSLAEGVAVGVLFFMSGARAEDGTGGGHAINVAIVGDDNNYEVIFIEPQLVDGKPVQLHLTEHELSSCWFVLI